MPLVSSPYGGFAAPVAAMVPVTNWAERRQQKQQELLYEQNLTQLAVEEAASYKAQQAAVMNADAQLRAMPMLDPDRRRWDQELEGLHQRVASKIMTTYNGDAHKYFEREGGADYEAAVRGLLSSPVYQNSRESLANYGRYQADVAAGKYDSPISYERYNPQSGQTETVTGGTFAKQYADYLAGNVKKLTYNGGYEGPKDFAEYYAKTAHPTTPYGVLDPTTKQVRARGVSRDDLLGYAVSKGLRPEQALDWVDRRLGYKDGMLSWKREQQDPWDARKQAFDEANAKAQLGLGYARLAQADRYHKEAQADRAARNGGSVNNVDLLRDAFEGKYGLPRRDTDATGAPLTWGKLGRVSEVDFSPAAANALIPGAGGLKEPLKENGKIVSWGSLPPGTKVLSGTGGGRTLTGSYDILGTTGKTRVAAETVKTPGGRTVVVPRYYIEATLKGHDSDLKRDNILWGGLWDTETEDFRNQTKPLDSAFGGNDVYQFRTWIPYNPENQITAGMSVGELGIGSKAARSTYKGEQNYRVQDSAADALNLVDRYQ